MTFIITTALVVATSTTSGVLAPVEVVGARVGSHTARAARATQVIDRAAIERSGARHVGELLAARGLDVAQSFRGTTLRLSGLEPEHVLVRVDGVPVIGRVDGALDLSRLSVGDVERVEIIRGAASALHGADALAGVVEITTRRPRRGASLELSVHGRSLPGLDTRARAAWSGEHARLQLSGGLLHSSPWDLVPADEPTTGAGYTGGELGARGEYDVDADLRLGARAHYQRRGARAVDTGAGAALFDRSNLVESGDAALELRSFLATGRRLDVLLAWSTHRDQSLLDQRGAADLDAYADTHQHQGLARALWTERWGEAHRLALGAEATLEAVSTPRLTGGAGERARGALFGEYGWSLDDTNTWVVVPGARLDLDTSFGLAATPQLAVRVEPWPELRVRLSFGMGFRAPSFQEQLLQFQNVGAGYVVEGNPDLEPETSRSWAARVELTPLEALSLAVGATWNDVAALITTDVAGTAQPGQPVVYRYANVDEARTRSAELEVGWHEDLGEHWAVGAELHYELLDARDVGADQPLDGRAAHTLSARLEAEYVPLGLSWSSHAVWTSSRPFVIDDEVRRSAARVLVGTRGAAQLWDEHLQLELGVENLLDTGDAALDPLPPRTFYAGLTGRL
jgi:outer membrane receptor for ferrienterochelin and colicins